jgi:Spy/CpxP family protein refolding chaperone
VKQASQKAAELASRGVEEHAALRSEVYAVLTPEQRAQLPKLRQEMQARMKERRAEHGKGMRGPPPSAPSQKQ